MKVYTLVQSTLDDTYKIRITTKWFGVTVWSSFYCAEDEHGFTDISWRCKQEAVNTLKSLTSVERFIEVKEEKD